GAEALFNAAMLQELYPDFHRLLALSDDMDPLEEFTGYLAVVATVKAAEAGSADTAAASQSGRAMECLERNGIQAAEITRESLVALESVVPESIPRLAHDKVFAGLVKALVGSAAEREVRAKLRRRRLAAIPAPPTEPLANDLPVADPSEFAGLTILWLGTDGDDVSPAIRLNGGGATVISADSADQALRRIAQQQFDVVITSREGRFDEIVALRDAGFDGQVIIFTHYISPARRDRASMLSALITSDPAELLRFVAQARTSVRSAVIPRDLVGLRVLWFAPFENTPLRDHLLARGAEVFSASTPEAGCDL